MALKAKELMVGDWVIHNRTYPKEMHTPKQVLGMKNMPCAKMPGMYIMLEGVDTHEYNCTPIPLTEEILKTNGWELLSFYDREAYYAPNGGFCLDLRNGLLRLIIHGKIIIIQYVHELQRALRCCGLWDIAEKFKIE